MAWEREMSTMGVHSEYYGIFTHRVWTHAALLLPVTLKPQNHPFLGYPQVIPYTKFEHFGDHSFWVTLRKLAWKKSTWIIQDYKCQLQADVAVILITMANTFFITLLLTYLLTYCNIKQTIVSEARFPFKRNRLCCVNKNRKKSKLLRWQAANHGCHCFDRAFLLAGACVCCVNLLTLAFLAVFIYAMHATQAIAFKWKPGISDCWTSSCPQLVTLHSLRPVFGTLTSKHSSAAATFSLVRLSNFGGSAVKAACVPLNSAENHSQTFMEI